MKVTHQLGLAGFITTVRGKGGGIKIANSPEEAEQLATQMIGMLLKTHQAPEGVIVEKLLIEEPINIVKEFYIGVVPDRASQRNVLIVSARSGGRTPRSAGKGRGGLLGACGATAGPVPSRACCRSARTFSAATPEGTDRAHT